MKRAGWRPRRSNAEKAPAGSVMMAWSLCMATKGKGPPVNHAAPDERQLFEQAMAGVRPLRQRGSTAPTPLDVTMPEPMAPPTTPREDPPPPLVDGPSVRGRASGVSETTLKQLAKGAFPIEGTCNLHGYREVTARHRIETFLAEARRAQRRAVAVVCGRGLHSGPLGPVLRRVCLEELSKHMAKGSILAVSSAPPKFGGDGAFLILLPRDRA